MRRLFSLLFMLSFIAIGTAQEGTPTDYLSKDFHKQRRELIRSKMPKNSVAVVLQTQ